MRNRIILTLLALALIVTAGFLASCQTSPTASVGSTNQQTGIWVNGEGKVTVTPDIANLQLGVEAQAGNVGEAQASANAAMNSVMDALKANGVAEKDIQTRFFNIQRVTRYDPDTQQEITIGYRVSNTVNAKIRNVSSAGTVIDAVAQAGGDLTRVDSISFAVDDPIRFNDEAREKAMADAADKAKRLAELAGVKLGKATFISESSASVPPSPIFARDFASVEAKATPISPGETDIILNIQVVYSIR